MKRNNKIKYLSFKGNLKYFSVQEIAFNPTPYKDPPDGRYLVRGDSKGESKSYIKKNGKWYYHQHCKNGATTFKNPYVLAEYSWLPCLSEREWAELIKHKDKLSPYWKTMVYAKEITLTDRGYVVRGYKKRVEILKQFNNEYAERFGNERTN
jgi:hypothetical protein